MWFRMLAPVLLLPILPFWVSAAAHAASPVGYWITDTGKGKIKVSKCGSKLCAKIVWLRDPVDERGKPWRDGYNPDPALRRRKVVGISTFRDMRKAGPNLWIGAVYSPEEGKTYENIEVSVLDRQTLKLRGCKVMGIVCGHKLWTRTKHTAKKKKVVAAARQKAKAPPRRETRQRAPAPPVQAAPPRARALATDPRPRQAPRAAAPAPIREARIAPPRAVASPPPRAAGVPTAQGGQGFVVQLSARRSEESARIGVGKLRQRYPMLQDYEATIQRADLGDSGVWYRLRFGTLRGKSAAKDLCAELIASGLTDCLVRTR